MNPGPQKRVPAVANALAILELFRTVGNTPQKLSDIARATGMNVSTCFNILKTLEDGRVIAFDPGAKTYRLGLYLTELAALVDDQREAAELVMEEVRRACDVIGLGCFLMTRTGREEFVVLDKVESRNPIRVTIDVGARFPATGAVAVKAWYAWADDDVVTDLIERHGLPGYTEHSITDADEFRAELTTVRQRGYSTSIGEYYPDHNAVAAPVYDWAARPQFLLVVVGASGQLTGSELERVGEELVAAADRATKRIGGRAPGEAHLPDASEVP